MSKLKKEDTNKNGKIGTLPASILVYLVTMCVQSTASGSPSTTSTSGTPGRSSQPSRCCSTSPSTAATHQPSSFSCSQFCRLYLCSFLRLFDCRLIGDSKNLFILSLRLYSTSGTATTSRGWWRTPCWRARPPSARSSSTTPRGGRRSAASDIPAS